MQLIPGKIAAARVAGILHPKYQVHAYSVNLTARGIASVDPVGQIDFGGSEYAPAGRMPIQPQRQRAEDPYQWWDLGRGTYFVTCNETLELAQDEIALIEPDERLLRTGAWHVPMFVRGRVAPVEILLEVGVSRLRVKENARLSRVRLFRFDGNSSDARPAAAAAKKKAAKRSSKH